MFVINCSTLIFFRVLILQVMLFAVHVLQYNNLFIVCLYVPAARYTLLFANHLLQHGDYFYRVLTCPCCKSKVVIC